MRAGLLTEVRPPTPAEEAVRDLCRARDDAREDLQRCRHRLGKLLLRRGLHHQRAQLDAGHIGSGLNSLDVDTRLPSAAVVDDYLLAIDHVEARLVEFDARLTDDRRRPTRISEPVGWLRCFRGIDTLTAILILAELHDFRRFHSPRALMALSGPRPGRGLHRREASARSHHADRATRWSAGCWWKPRGIINIGRASAWRSRDDGKDNPAG